ncbi:MAG TPA: type II secretion system protein [bacterium]|nr:type II secretion system protein [bacterium]
MNNKGFTLIELILVIAILGIMAVSAMPKIFSLTNEANEAVMNGVLGQLQAAVAIWEAKQMATTGSVPLVAQFDALPNNTLCSVVNRCFSDFLKDPITQSGWRKKDKFQYLYDKVSSGKLLVFMQAQSKWTRQNPPPPPPP